VDPELFLLDLGFAEAWDLTGTGAAPQPVPGRRFLAA
jgi:hypothetical protein